MTPALAPAAARRPATPSRAQAARARLGIPPDAARVLVLCESSHWDPGWLLDTTGYFRLRVARILDEAIAALEAEPTRVYNVESTYFLRRYWDERPAMRARVERLLASRRLRLASPSLTSPDTVVTHGEAVLRDLEAGARWLRARGVEPPRTLYLPDSFGHSPLLPSLLAAAGIEAVAFARVDGLGIAGSDLGPPARRARPGSTAAHLRDELGSLDLIWRDPAGAELLAHWHAAGYGQGDLIAHRGLTRWMGVPLALPSRSERAVARRLEALAATLAAHARTPYLLCPIGFDFVSPVPRLGALLERYVRHAYPSTGLWVVSAGLDDWADLIDDHRDALAVVALDPNPCFMGFPASRPALKASYQRVVAGLLAADAAAAVGRADPARVREGWDRAVLANHHDFVTGTSRAAVVEREQAPLLAALEHELSSDLGAVPTTRPPARAGAAPRWRALSDGTIVVQTATLELVLDPAHGGTLIHAIDRRSGRRWLDAGSLAARAYLDDGGLWRLGHEVWGGRLVRRADSRGARARLEVIEGDRGLTVRVHARAGAPVPLELTVAGDAPELAVAITAPPRRRRTWTVLTRGLLGPHADARLTMAVPGGLVRRPFEGATAPTYWAADGLIHVAGADGDGTALLSALPLAVRADAGGGLEWIVHRHATGERTLRVVPLLGFPVRGGDRTPHRVEVVLRRVTAADELAALVTRVAALRAGAAGAELPGAIANLTLDRRDVVVAAVAPAARGPGVIVRLAVPARGTGTAGPRGAVRVRWPAPLAAATRCDALERDLAPLPVAGGTVAVPLDAALVTVRLVPAPAGAA